MKVPFSWLKELVDIDVTAQELEEKEPAEAAARGEAHGADD